MFKETERGETQYCPMCEEWAEQNTMLVKIQEEYYSRIKELSKKLFEIEKYIKSNIECNIETLINADETQLTEKGIHFQKIMRIIINENNI